jgi:hypothetical protein
MKIKKIFIHIDFTSECILDIDNFTIRRLNDNQEGDIKVLSDKELGLDIISIRWYNSNSYIYDEFIKYNFDNSGNYYYKPFCDNYILNYDLNEILIIHSEWRKTCILNINKNIIFKKDEIKEKGNYKINGNILNIKWDLWGEESFIKLENYYYQEKYLIELLNKDIINKDDKIESDNYNNIEVGKIDIVEDVDKVNKYNNYNELEVNVTKGSVIDYFKKIEENKKNNEIMLFNDKFKKIGDNFYFSYKNTILSQNSIPNKNEFIYKILNCANINNIVNKFELLLKNNSLINNNYLNQSNIKNYIKYYKEQHENNVNKCNIKRNIWNSSNDLIDDYAILKLDFKIEHEFVGGKSRCLTIADWGYPPFGGGENWLLTMNKIFNKNKYENYDNYFICFFDPFKNQSYDNINMIELNYVKIIQMPKDLIQIIKMIKILNPVFINHQGSDRLFYMKISNILQIPFLTGFCFWQNIIKFNGNNINLNMISNQYLEKTDEFMNIIKNSYTYVASNFVNDIIYKFYNLKLDLIETISIKDDFHINSNFIDDFDKMKYVTIINCHYNKGGYLLKYLCENVDFNIPLQIIYTEHDPVITIEYVTQLLNERNKKNNINIIIIEKINIKLVYMKTRILLIPSLCEETFCRVAYEGMMNKIPILSTKNGNLKYLLGNYAIFIDEFNICDWKNNIEAIYFDKNKIMLYQNIKYSITEDIIEDKIIKKINLMNDNKSKYILNDKHIGIIIPWADQGLGIQGRDYYITLKNIGYEPYIFSFKPYHCTHDNLLLQTDRNEWMYENIYYSQNYRENIDLDEIINFIYNNKIKKIIIIEATFINIFRISFLLKLLGIQLYLVVNIECIRIIEINYHDIFDKLLTNNNDSYNIMSSLYPDKTYHLGFHFNHSYFSNTYILKNNIKDIYDNTKLDNTKVIKFFCIGGLNSISRKNINLIIQTFYNIYQKNYNLNINLKWILNVYIQGVEIPDIIKEYQCDNIYYNISNLSYKEIIDKYIENDIFIHMGSHEGLGLGFYESLYCGTPVITMNWTPNNEIIKDRVNGWLINCEYSNIYDNDISLIQQGIINEDELKDKIISILDNMNETLDIINNTISNIKNLQNINKIEFEKKFYDILS